MRININGQLSFHHQPHLTRSVPQDLVEELSKETTWYTPRKVSQQAYERNADGSFKGFEEEVGSISLICHVTCMHIHMIGS